MKTSTDKFQESYDAQAVVEGENQLVVGAEVSNNANDNGQLIPMIDVATEVCAETPGKVQAGPEVAGKKCGPRYVVAAIPG